MNSRQGLVIVIILLLLALLGIGWWAYGVNNEKKSLTEQNDLLNKQMGDITAIKDQLQHEVDSLQQAFTSLADENESLKGDAAEARRKVNEKEVIIKQIKSQSASETAGLKAQIQELLKVKSDLQDNIGQLKSENESLKAQNTQLTADLSSVKSENDELNSLNKTIQEELKKLTLANFKASAFRVEVERKRPKATAKAGRARRIRVSFDLAGVKQEYQGLRTLYLVLTDDKGTPIKLSKPISAQVKVNGEIMDILAAQSKEINIGESQRIDFSHELEDKLKSGYYRVAVYTDIGLLGASSFRLQ